MNETAPGGLRFMGSIGLELFTISETINKNWEHMNPSQRVLLRNAYFNHDLTELNNLNMAITQLLDHWGFDPQEEGEKKDEV